MSKIEIAKEYCVGCGLCKSKMDCSFEEDGKGFKKISGNFSAGQEKFVESVCPVIGENYSKYESDDIWGKNRGFYSSYSSDENIRYSASSGGTLTALSLYLLENNYVDGIIHISKVEDCVYETKCQVSTTREEIISCCGSRYSISSPWVNLQELVATDKKYAAIGKPCDIMALRNAKDKLGMYSNIVYLLSFFCAGLPSNEAQKQLLSRLQCEKSCESLTYRGNGWPGYTTAVDKDGNEHTLEYAKSWGGILGRDVHKFCRICMDGIGVAADIACADGWFIANGEPDFSEHAGRNLVIVRNDCGLELFRGAFEKRYICAEEWNDISELKIIQKYQYTRRATMRSKVIALILFGRKNPKYNKAFLKKMAQNVSISEEFEVFKGTVKRILKGKI